MAGLPAAPFINLLSPLRLKSKTDDWNLPGPRATAFFWCYVIRVCHTPYYEKISFGGILSAPSRTARAADPRRQAVLRKRPLFCITWFCSPLKPALFSYYVISRNRRDVPGVPRLTRGGHTHLYRSEEHTSELQSLRHLVCR